MKKVLLILVDGMRPDVLSGICEYEKISKRGALALDATTVYPSVTLPCHVSLFLGVEPNRHGTLTNTYVPQVRPVKGICEAISDAGKQCALFYTWGELRDICVPDSVSYSVFSKGALFGYDRADEEVTAAAIDYLNKNDVDFTFLYLGYPDFAGHRFGWLSDEYMHSVKESFKRIDRVLDSIGNEYTVIITADHGGHGRTHGTDMPEDMLIPIIAIGEEFKPGELLCDANIMDIAPTVAELLSVKKNDEWEGKSLI